MHQVISLHSNIFLILPPEILSLILDEVSLDTVSTIQILSSVDSMMRCYLNNAAPYVSKMLVSELPILDIFSGVKHLLIMENHDIGLNLNDLGKIMLGNIESLAIPYKSCLQLDTRYKDEEEIRLKHPMSKLRSLEIYTRSQHIPLMLDKDLLPNLKNLSHKCPVRDYQFGVLEVLKIYYVRFVDFSALNNMNLVELSLISISCLGKWFKDVIVPDIPTLRKLKLKNSYMLNIDRLKNLEILILKDSIPHSGIVSMRNLKRLDIIFSEQKMEITIKSSSQNLRFLNICGYSDGICIEEISNVLVRR